MGVYLLGFRAPFTLFGIAPFRASAWVYSFWGFGVLLVRVGVGPSHFRVAVWVYSVESFGLAVLLCSFILVSVWVYPF